MFRKHSFLVKTLAVAAVLGFLTAAPAVAQHRAGGYRGGTYHVSYAGRYGGGFHYYGYYPSHGYYGHYRSPAYYGYYPYGYYSGYRPLNYPGHYYYGSYTYPYSSYYSRNPYYSYPPSGYQSFYAPASSSGAPVGVDQVVHVTINVPLDAEIWFNGQKASAIGSLREFVSPPLTSGWQYTYEVRARWTENGRAVTQTWSVTVHPGERVTLTFPEKTPTQGK